MTLSEKILTGLLATFLVLGIICSGVYLGTLGKDVSTGGGVDFNDFYAATVANVQVGPQASVTVLATSTGRTFASLSNGSSTAVYLCFNAAPCSIGTGILLSASSTYEITPEKLYTGAITARAMASTSLMVTSKN